MRSMILPNESALGKGPSIQLFQKSFFFVCSIEFRLPARVSIMTKMLRTILAVGILGLILASLTCSINSRREQTFSAYLSSRRRISDLPFFDFVPMHLGEFFKQFSDFLIDVDAFSGLLFQFFWDEELFELSGV